MARPAKLVSDGERRIIELAIRGKTDKEICTEIGVAMTTVRTHWQRMRKKMGAVNRAQAIAEYSHIQAEQTRRAYEARDRALRGLVNQFGAGVWEWRLMGPVKVDRLMGDLFGLTPGSTEVDASEILRRMPDEDRRRLLSALHQAAWGQESVELKVRVGEPTQRTLQMYLIGTTDGDNPVVIGVTAVLEEAESMAPRAVMV